MSTPPDLTQLTPEQLRQLAAELMTRVEQQDQVIQSHDQALQQRDQTIQQRDLKIGQLTHEVALLRRHKYGQRSEHLNALQISLLDEVTDADIAGIETELEPLQAPAATPAEKRQPKRSPLPPELPRTEVHHEPDNTACACGCQLKRIGEDVSEKLDYTPGVFTVERHIRGKWVCDQCDTLLKEAVLHADETPVPMLSPGKKKTHKAYIWAYASTAFSDLNAVIYHFTPGRSGQHARDMLGEWSGKQVCDDYSGYKANFAKGVTEIGCMAHARRKFVELEVSGKSQIAGQAVEYIRQLYEIERDTAQLSNAERHRIRQRRAKPITDGLYRWMQAQRTKVPNGTATAKALDYSLKRWAALTRYLDDGAVPIDNNRGENLIRSWALGRKNWLFAGSQRSGQRAANIMSLIQSAKLNGHEPYAYLKDVLARLPTQKASAIHELLPQHWSPGA